MRAVPTESIVEVLTLIGSTIGAAVLTAGGVFLESAAIEDALAGQLGIGAWEVVAGGLLLFVGLYLLGYQNVWNRIRERGAT
jgi:hypothetical protein